MPRAFVDTLRQDLALCLIALLPGAAWTEGAVRLLDCTAVKVCDAAAACTADSVHVAFRMEPVERAADGSGSYTLSYGDTKAEMRALSDAGPFVWTVGDERNTLLASSETQFVWHRLAFDPAPHATVRFLACALRQ